jgi:hypothetical protein
MVSVLGFTGLPGEVGAASYGCPIRGPFGRVSAVGSTRHKFGCTFVRKLRPELSGFSQSAAGKSGRAFL